MRFVVVAPPPRLRVLLALISLVVSLVACAPPDPTPPTLEPRTPDVHPLEERVAQAGLLELRAGLADGAYTAAEITEASLARIARLDPALRAVIATNPDALAIARELDAERAEGRVRGPLHGIPVMLKDNVESLDSLPTTAGSLALADNVTGRDAFVAARLREAGAVILGKANLSEWANFRSERSSSGWSAVGGQARNPYDTSRSPCGSSSGSAVAVAAGLSTLAVGTETNGSIVCPASVNGIVGIKPTFGIVSRTGIVPVALTQDTAGPMARTVAGAALMLEAMIGVDEADPVTVAALQASDWNLAEHLDAAGLVGKRIGVVRNLAGFHEAVDALLEGAIDDLRANGATVVDDLGFPPATSFWADVYEVLLHEFRHDVDAYLATLPDPELAAMTLDDLIAFNEANAAEEMPYFRQEIFEMAAAKGSLDEPAYTEALAAIRRAARDEGIDALLAEHDLDALIAPTVSPAWTIDLVLGDHYLGGSSGFPAAAGYPHVTVPMGYVHGLPVGLSIMGAAFAEPTLIEIAYGYEQATKHRVPPELEPAVAVR